MLLKIGDTVKVIAGGNSKKANDKGKTGEIIKINRKDNTVTVKGINVVVKHNKPTQNKPEGSITTFEAPINASNVAYFDTKSNKIIKLGVKFVDGKKVRIDRKTGLELGKAAPKKAAAKKTTTKKVEEETVATTEETK